VTISAGQTTADFDVQTHGVAALTVATIQATANGSSIYYGIRLYPAVPLHIQYNPNPCFSGTDVTATLTINGAAPPGGLTATLTAQNPDVATGPATVTVPEGQGSVTFTVKTKKVTSNQLAVFRATANGSNI